MAIAGSSTVPILIVLGVISVFGIITFALTAATLGTLNKRYNDLQQQISDLNNKLPTIASSTMPTPTGPSVNTTTTLPSVTSVNTTTTLPSVTSQNTAITQTTDKSTNTTAGTTSQYSTSDTTQLTSTLPSP
jgi:hypothetical protein